MAIKFVDGSQLRAENLICVLYGVPNAGKTSLALTAPKPILFDFDGGSHRAGNKYGKSIVRVESWSDIAGLDAADIKDFETIVVDTVGTCLDYLAADVIRVNPKHGMAGALTLQGYGQLKTRFKAWLSLLRTMNKDIVLIAHMLEQTRGDDIVHRIVAPGSSRDEVYQSADIMGHMQFRGKKRVLSFNPNSQSYGKNVGLPDYELPDLSESDDTLARILRVAKDCIDASSKAEDAARERVETLKEWIDNLSGGAEVFNNGMSRLEGASAAEKHLYINRAKVCGLKFDRASKTFTEVSKATETELPF